MVQTQQNLSLTVVDTPELPSALAADWRRLAAGMPLHDWDWYEPWWRHYRTTRDRLCVLVAHDTDRQVRGIIPWYQSRSLASGKVLRFLGDNEICTDYQSLLALPQDGPAVGRTVAHWLLAEGSDRWDLLDWRGKTADDSALCELSQILESQGATFQRKELENSWRIELPDTWEAYLRECISKSRREKVRYLERRYFKSGRAVHHVLESPAQIDEYLNILVELHQARRAELGDAGCFADPAFLRFHREVMQRMAATGRLRLHYVTLDGQPAAAEYSLLGDDGQYYYQSGMQPKLGHDKPGWLCLMSSLRLAIESKLKFFDFLRGNEAYKASWGARPIPLAQRRIAARNPLSQLRNAVRVAGERFRHWAKSCLRPVPPAASEPPPTLTN
ncbi:MAG: GNAT family N-acetyltransferase [Pirellulales bacterium]|nr:GNAT family N-acetyltransferase [Pirellulales bacterium]